MSILLRKLTPSIRAINLSSRSYCLSADLKCKFDEVTKADKVVIFMKGNPDAPQCGFSNAVNQVIKMHGVPYAAYDVLSDDTIRDGIKKYTNWPTIPQVFVNGKFIGGCDILLQMHRSGELVDCFKEAGLESTLGKEEVTTKKEE